MQYINMEKVIIRRGDIWLVNLQENNYPYMLKNTHPCLIISNYKCLNNSPIIQVIPITSKPKSQPMHVELGTDCGLNKKSICLIEQITTVNKEALIHQIGKISYEKMIEVEQQVQMQLGIKNNYSIEMFETVKGMLDEIEELDRYLESEYNEEIFKEKEVLIKDLSKYCINHSIRIDLEKFKDKKERYSNVTAI